MNKMEFIREVVLMDNLDPTKVEELFPTLVESHSNLYVPFCIPVESEIKLTDLNMIGNFATFTPNAELAREISVYPNKRYGQSVNGYVGLVREVMAVDTMKAFELAKAEGHYVSEEDVKAIYDLLLIEKSVMPVHEFYQVEKVVDFSDTHNLVLNYAD